MTNFKDAKDVDFLDLYPSPSSSNIAMKAEMQSSGFDNERRSKQSWSFSIEYRALVVPGKRMYAVWRGITLGLYFLWKDYQQQTNGYNRAEYKSFKHVRDVEEYLWRGPIY
jgi:hypothetical protein